MGAAWQPCAAMMHCLRRRTLWSTEALGPDLARVLGRLLSLLFIGRTLLMVSVRCPSPAPQPHWHMGTCRPSFAEDGRRVQRGCEGAETRITALGTRHRDGGRPSRSVW